MCRQVSAHTQWLVRPALPLAEVIGCGIIVNFIPAVLSLGMGGLS